MKKNNLIKQVELQYTLLIADIKVRMYNATNKLYTSNNNIEDYIPDNIKTMFENRYNLNKDELNNLVSDIQLYVQN